MYICTKYPYIQGISAEYDFTHSNNSVKKYYYASESYFQEAYYDFQSEQLDFAYIQKHISFLLLKPDFFVGADISVLSDIFNQLNLCVIGAWEYLFSRHTIRELWRYELNTATIDRYNLIDRLLTSGKSVFLLLYHHQGYFDLSHTLTDLKKQNNSPNILKGKTIRQYLNIGTGTLNFIHSPDEVIDFIREIGVLFDHTERREICHSIINNQQMDYMKILNDVAVQYPKIDFHNVTSYQKPLSSQEKIWHDIIMLNQQSKFKHSDILRYFDFHEVYDEPT